MDFDPDAYLAGKEKPAAAGFDPDAYLAGKTAPAPAPSGLDVAASRAQSLGHGIKDPITGGAQLLAHLLPDKAVEAGNELNNWLAKYGLTSPIPTKDAAGKPVQGAAAVDQQIRQDEAQVADARKAAGRGEGADWFRLAGNIASPANLAIASKVPAAATLGGRIGAGVAQGAGSSALTPVSSGDDFSAEKAKQVGAGAVIGGGIPVLTGAAAKIIKPITSKAADLLTERGVSLTPGQILGGWYQRAEDSLTSITGLGDAIKGAQRRGIVSFNTAAVNDALKPVGEKLPKGVEGQEAVAWAREKLGEKYDTLLPKLKGDLHSAPPANALPGGAATASKPSFMDEINVIRQMGNNLPAQQKRDLNRIIDREIVGKFTSSGKASGDTLKAIQETLKKEADNFSTGGPYERTLAGGIKELGSAMRRMIEDVNPGQAKELADINRGYAYFKRAQRASSTVGTKDGFFTPAQYNNAVKALDKTKDKRAFSEGTAMGQELAAAGKSKLSQTVPDSGTAGRNWLQSPGRFVMGLAAGIPAEIAYSGLGTRAMQAAMMSRPQGAESLAQLVRKSNPALTAGAVPLAELMMSTKGEGP